MKVTEITSVTDTEESSQTDTSVSELSTLAEEEGKPVEATTLADGAQPDSPVRGSYKTGAFVKTTQGWVRIGQPSSYVTTDVAPLEAALLCVMDVSLSRAQRVAALHAYGCSEGVFDESLAC